MTTSPHRGNQPKGPASLTFVYLMTDVVGSTALWLQDGDGMDECLQILDALCNEVAQKHNGRLIGERGEGDSHFMVFQEVGPAISAGAEIGLLLRADSRLQRITLRTAIHLGESSYRSGNYYGTAVNQCARIRSIACPGQILVSDAVRRMECAHSEFTFLSVGIHRLRDLPQSIELFQLVYPGLAIDFPNLPTSTGGAHHLPVSLTSYVGREEELRDVLSLCLSHRLTTVTGPGGMGKTRLAIQVAEKCVGEFVGGVWFIDLAATQNEPSVLAAIVAAFAERLVTDEASLIRSLQDDPTLLIFDNCEQVDRVCSAIAKTLLSACPKLRILATSRKALRFPGERVFQLGSMGSSKSGLKNEAVQLFLDRTKEHHVRSDLERNYLNEIRLLCEKLDGMPLAIEIVAGWTELLSVQEISERIDEFLERELPDEPHKPYSRTVAATIESSCQLLSKQARDLLVRLTIFPTTWTLEAAKSVCYESEDAREEVERLMSEVLAMSLVFPESVMGGKRRFRMLQTTSQVLSRHMGQTPMDLTQRFIVFFGEKSQLLKKHTDAGQDALAFSLAESDYDCFARAIGYAIAAHDSTCIAIAENLRGHWFKCSRIRDGKYWFQRLTGLPWTSPDERAIALSGLASFCIRFDELDQAHAALREAEQYVSDKQGYQWARIIGNQGTIYHRLGKLEEARDAFLACLGPFHELGYRSEEGLALINLGVCKMRLGDRLEECSEVFYRSLKCGEAVGSAAMQANAYSSLAEVHCVAGEYVKAIDFCHQSLVLYQKGVWLVQTAWTFVNLAFLLYQAGAIDASAQIWHAARRLEELANTHFTPRQQDILINLKGKYPDSISAERWAELDEGLRSSSADELISLAIKAIGFVQTKEP